ncbi:MAG: hypothetical protein J6W64_04040 [Bacilli bacterium]|nr:hypothetical protein [Bacilli bacterium]
MPAVELKRVIKEVLDDKKTLSIITNALGLNESLIKTKIVEDLEKTTPYMLRNDGAFLTCGDIHPYIKMQYKQPFDETYKALLTNYEFLDWFYYNTTNNEVKDLICKFLTLCEQTPNIIELKDKFGITNSLILGDDSLEKITNRLNDLTNQEFCRARTSNFKYKYGGDNGEIYFRISSKNFN